MEHKSTREKMSGMTRKEKVYYIWDYYKFHIIGTIILIGIISSFISNAVNRKIPVLSISLMGKYVDSEKLEALQAKSTEALVNDPKNKREISYEYLVKSDNAADQMTYASIQKLTASIAAKDVDILILDKEDFKNYADQGMFMPLTQLPDFSGIDLKSYETIKYTPKEGDGKENVYALSVEELPALKQINFDVKNKVLCIVANAQHLDKASEFLKWFLAQS